MKSIPSTFRSPLRAGFGICALLLLTAFVAQAAAPKKLLVVTVTKGFRHSSIPTAERVLAGIAELSGDFTVDFARTDAELGEKMSLEALKGYDGVIFANTTGMLPLPDRDGFLDWVRSGKAFIGMHSATDTFREFPGYVEMIGGSFRSHGAQVAVEALNEDPEHPATRHLGPAYQVHDEIYLLNNYHRDRVHLLLTLDKEPNKKVPGHYPIAWSKLVDEGRLFYTSLGHREDVWTSAPYQAHILGGIRWALGLERGDAKPQELRVELERAERREGFRPLFNGVNLEGWRLRNPDGHPSWSAQNGMLVNEIPEDGHGTDLVTEEKFTDFTIRCEYQVPESSNSGLYLRGRYEIQILEDFGRDRLEMGGNGALYNVKPPSIFVSRRPGEWQEVQATIRGNRVTVFLNGVKIHDDVEVPRPTGGELDTNVGEPGPIMIQGDHGAVAVRNIRIKPLR